MQSSGKALAVTDNRRVIQSLRAIVQGLRQSSLGLERGHGVSAAQLFVLRALAEGGRLSVGELAECTMTHQSSVSVVAAKLVKAGLARRQRSSDDARRVELAVTDAGRRVAAVAPDPFQDRMIEGLTRLGPVRRRALAMNLEAWVVAMGLGDKPGMFFESDDERRGRGR